MRQFFQPIATFVYCNRQAAAGRRSRCKVESWKLSPFAANVVPKLVVMATSFSCRVSAISAFCRPTIKPLHNQSPSRYRSHIASYSNFSPKIDWLP